MKNRYELFIKGTLGLYRFLEARGLYSTATTELQKARIIAEDEKNNISAELYAEILVYLNRATRRQPGDKKNEPLEVLLKSAAMLLDEDVVAGRLDEKTAAGIQSNIFRTLGKQHAIHGQIPEARSVWGEGLLLAEKSESYEIACGIRQNLAILDIMEDKAPEIVSKGLLESLDYALKDRRLAGLRPDLEQVSGSMDRIHYLLDHLNRVPDTLLEEISQVFHTLGSYTDDNYNPVEDASMPLPGSEREQKIKQARDYLGASLKLATHIKNYERLTYANHALAVIELKLNHLDEAEQLLKDAIEILKTRMNLELLVYTYITLAELEEKRSQGFRAKGDMQQATAHYQKGHEYLRQVPGEVQTLPDAKEQYDAVLRKLDTLMTEIQP